MKQGCARLVREFSALEPYQDAYTLVYSLEPAGPAAMSDGTGCWLSVCRSTVADSPAGRASAWVPAPEEECRRLLRFLYENSVQPELWQDTIACWYPQTREDASYEL